MSVSAGVYNFPSFNKIKPHVVYLGAITFKLQYSHIKELTIIGKVSIVKLFFMKTDLLRYQSDKHQQYQSFSTRNSFFINNFLRPTAYITNI